MRRKLIYGILLLSVFLAPVRPHEVEKLIPVQVVSVSRENGGFLIRTDTEDKGKGSTLQEALQNLKDTANGVLYLDTARYLLLTEDVMEEMETLNARFRRTVKLCLTEGSVELKEIGTFLNAHADLPKLKHWKKGMELPVLSTYGDSFIFLKKVENSA